MDWKGRGGGGLNKKFRPERGYKNVDDDSGGMKGVNKKLSKQGVKKTSEKKLGKFERRRRRGRGLYGSFIG